MTCPTCGAIQWGNANCETCRSHWPDEPDCHEGNVGANIAGGRYPSVATTRLWTASVDATFEADNAEDAAAVAKRLTERVLEHPQVWSVEGYFEDEQTPEVVDV